MPLVWDNWTNNDTAGNATPLGTARIFLGPYLREPESAGAVGGFFFNAANEAYLNLLPLATAGDWMTDPGNYRARRSWVAAIRELAPGRRGTERKRRASLRAWAEASWSNKLDREREAPTFVAKADRFLARLDAGGGWPGRLRRLLRELRLVEAAPRRLPGLPEPGIAEQGAEFLDAAAKTALAGDLAAQLLATERPLLERRPVAACVGAPCRPTRRAPKSSAARPMPPPPPPSSTPSSPTAGERRSRSRSRPTRSPATSWTRSSTGSRRATRPGRRTRTRRRHRSS